MPKMILTFYTQHVPSGEALASQTGQVAGVTEDVQRRLIALGAFLISIMTLVIVPLMLVWLVLVYRFLAMNYRFHSQALRMQKDEIIRRCIKMAAIALVVAAVCTYSVFFDIQAFIDGMYFVYLASAFLLIFSMGQIVISVGAIILSIITTIEKE